MSHEHRQHPERFYDEEGEAYEHEPDATVYPLSIFMEMGSAGMGQAGTARTWTWTPKAPEPMTRRQTYRHCIKEGWRRWDAFLVSLLSAEERPVNYEGPRPTFTVERTD